jgi:ligand-binding sensor domain-containing protein
MALAFPSMALGSHHLADDYIRTDFNVEDGLPDDVVDAIVQTANGFLWVGTESGLATFDGRHFSPINIHVPGSPAQGAVNALLEASNGDLWVGTDAGIVRIPKKAVDQFDPAELSFYQLGPTTTNRVVALHQTRDGELWAGTDHGLFRLKTGKFVPVAPDLAVDHISDAFNGHLALITSHGLREWDGHQIINRPEIAAGFGVRENEIFSVTQDRAGTTWYCTMKGIAHQVGNTFVRLYPLDLWRTAAFRASEDPQGRVWISSKNGLYRVTGDVLETPAPGLHAHAFFAGKDGELWIGTNGLGLVHLKPRVVHMFTKADGLQNDVTMAVLASHDGKVWVGGNCGLAVYDGKTFKTYEESDGLLNSCVWSLAEDKDHYLWIGTWGGGVFRFKDSHFDQYSLEQGLASNVVTQVVVGRDNSLWIATAEGLSHMKNGRIQNYSTADGLSSNQILSIYEDKFANIWAQTQGGVDRFDGERFVPFSLPQLKEGAFVAGLAADSSGDLYTLNSPKGISLIREHKLIGVNEDIQVLNMIETTQHDLWFTGRNGIIRISRENLIRSVSDHDAPLDYFHLDRTDGLNSIQCSVGAPNIAITPDNKLWVATVKGLAMIDLVRLSQTSRKPEVFVGAITLDKTKVLAGQQLLLRPGAHHVELHLEALDISSPEKIRLQYRMDGVDANWLDADSSWTAIYTTIPPGTHPFHFRGTSSDGVWDRVGIVYNVTQEPYFYQTTWFLLIVASTVVLLLCVAYLIRAQQIVHETRIRLEERYVERERIARELHDTILQGFHGLMLRLGAGVELVPWSAPARGILDDALRRADRVLDEGRNKIQSLRSLSMDSPNLANELERVAVSYILGTAIKFAVRSDDLIQTLDSVAYDEILAIGREAIVNAIRHADASEIVVELHCEPRRFVLICQDDGCGIVTRTPGSEKSARSFGILGMRERARKLSGELTIVPAQPKGTIVLLKVPDRVAYRRRRLKLPPLF